MKSISALGKEHHQTEANLMAEAAAAQHCYETSRDWEERILNHKQTWELVNRFCAHRENRVKKITIPKRNSLAQKRGVDMVVDWKPNNHSGGGGNIKIEWKFRRNTYDDLLLEIWSDRERKWIGWAMKRLQCTFLAYVQIARGRVYWLAYPPFYEWWVDNRSTLLTKPDVRCITVQQKNGHHSVNAAIPWRYIPAEIIHFRDEFPFDAYKTL